MSLKYLAPVPAPRRGFEVPGRGARASLPECSFDKDALTQILVNLIDNAVKYGADEVRIEAEARNGEVVLKVLDRGPGVPAAERETIFEAFNRGGAADRGGGSGLGLALVKHYASAHQGSIEVGDRAGVGPSSRCTCLPRSRVTLSPVPACRYGQKGSA